jgi:hypothetical protein
MSENTRIAMEKIEAGIAAVRESDRFREYLAFCGRLRLGTLHPSRPLPGLKPESLH